MKNFFIFSAMFLLVLSKGFSVEVQINLTSSYAQDVWYSLDNLVVASEPKDNWDFAFQTDAFNLGIWTNSQKGVKVWVVPNSDIDTFDKPIDTTGMSANWVSPSNSVETWNIGALNDSKDGFGGDGGDYGWGYYDPNNHSIQGYKCFIIQLADKKYYRFMVEGLVNKVFYIKWANVDGTSPQTASINKASYLAKNFVYYSIKDKLFIGDREPDSSEWSLLFGKYTGMVANGNGGFSPYTVTGVRTNRFYRTAKVSGDVNTSKAPELNSDNYSNSITAIGDDWKKFNNTSYTITPNVSYFVTNVADGVADPRIDKIVFKTFEGGTTGKLTFDLNPKNTAVVENDLSNSIIVYPSIINPTGTINVDLNLIDLKNVNLKIIDLNGRELFSQTLPTEFIGNKINLKVDNLTTGIYFILFNINGNLVSEKFIVE